MRKNRTFYNIFISILILGFVLVISFSSYIYLSSTRSVISRMADSQESLITQTRNTLEQKIQSIEYAFNTYSMTKSFSDAINNPLTVQDFETYRELNSQLSYISTVGFEFGQYSLISLKQNWSISNGSISRLTEADRGNLHESYIDQQIKGIFWFKTDKGLRFVHTLPVYSKYKQAIAMTDIATATLNSMLQTKADSAVYIINKQGELLYAAETGKDKLTQRQIGHISASASHLPQTGQITFTGEKGSSLTALYAKSSYNNWLYVTLLDKSKMSGALTTIRLGLIIMGVVMMLLIVFVAYFLSIHLSKPIRKIQSSLSKSSEPMLRDEVDWIIRSIDSIVSEKEGLESLIELEKPKLEIQFMLNLLHNRLTLEEVWRGVNRFEYGINSETVFVAMLVQLDSYGDRQHSDRDLLLFAVNTLLQDIVPQSGRLLPVVLNERTQATILQFHKTSEQEIRKQIIQYAKTVIKSSREYLKASVSIGISNLYTELTGSKEACDMGMEALHQRLNLGKESIIFFDDISAVLSGPILLQYPTELEVHLFDAIRLGDEQEVSRFLYPLLAEMMKLSKNPLHLEITLIRFVNNLIQLEQLIGAEVLLTKSNSNLYHRLLDTRNPEEIERILVEQFIYPMVNSMKVKTSQQFRSIADKMATIIHTEYDQNLSLESISERLHYSPNYLSSIFKKEYVTTFSEYLMNYRLEIAKKWLVDTEMTIKDIADRLCYQNPQNFIRSFRKKEQLTPGAYRKMKLGA